MTEDRLSLAELLAKAGDGDFLRNVAEAVVQLLMEADVEGVIGSGRHERTLVTCPRRSGPPDMRVPEALRGVTRWDASITSRKRSLASCGRSRC